MAKVLVVDDDLQICEAIEDILEEAGYSVVSANDGKEALDILEKGRFDLALIDVMMPKIDGYHLATHINGLPHPPAVIFVSARDVNQDEKIVESLGVAAFVNKPFEKKELLRVVSNILKRKGGGLVAFLSNRLKLAFLAVVVFVLACAPTKFITKDSFVRERAEYVYVVASAPIPAEISNKTQAMSLARDAAITLGQTSLLTYVLSKKTKSKKTLGEAEIPYIKLQNGIRGMIQGAQVTKTRYENDACEVTLAISKAQVKELLRKN